MGRRDRRRRRGGSSWQVYKKNLVKPPMKRIDNVTWEIPKTFKEGMRVNARVIGTEEIVNNMDLAVYDQITNVATLPGIIEPAYVMPDGHSGYGFPIGGVAAIDVSDEKGVISPGGIGFDINCLEGDTRILMEHGYTKTIAELEKDWQQETAKVMNFSRKDLEHSKMIYFLKKTPDKPILKMKTITGHTIVGTSDHPIRTPEGMVPLGELKVGTKVAVYPFEGVSYEKPPEGLILTEEDVLELDLPYFDINAIIKELKKRELLPLDYKSPKLPYLIKIFGFLLGDGSVFTLSTESKGFAWFYGQPEDLKDLQEDIKRLGWTPSKIYTRIRDVDIETNYGKSTIKGTEHSIRVTSRSFVALLAALGFPLGNKANQDFLIPPWIMKSPRWMKRLFLAAFFGAEMSTPSTMTNHGYNFYMPAVGVNKKVSHVESGRKFLEQIRKMLSEFDVETAEITQEDNFYKNSEGIQSVRLRLLVKQDNYNLIRLYSRIGYEYNKKKQFLALMAVQYLKLKESILKQREDSIETARKLREQGMKPREIVELLSKNEYINERFVKRSIYEERKTRVRIPENFPTFDQFIELHAVHDETNNTLGWIWDTIASIETVENTPSVVYDFTVAHEDHNFIANGIIVSNCGMRLVTTNLEAKDVKPKLREIVDLLFERVPAGVGSRGFVRLSPSEFKEVVEMGSKWCIEHGYGWEEDLARTELFGCMEGADSSKISKKAIQRGLNQVGTLGSGNHYLEIQVVKEENIFDHELAKKFGIFPNQVVIMFHCGSRGFGHQVATDYLQLFLSVMERKYGIKILDRELACAPFNSKEGQDYYSAMKCGVNMSFANRQTILHRIREVFSKVFKTEAEDLGLKLIYDVSHNRASIHKQRIDGEMKEILVHRKGATAAFGPGREEIPQIWRNVGQPVIIGGSMETGSYLLVGTEQAERTYYTTAHGSGRTMSRTKARKIVRGEELIRDLEKRGIYVRSVSYSGAAEEAGIAYKDIHKVCEATELAGISKRVVSLIPIGNVKG